MKQLFDQLANLKQAESLSQHTTFKIGGPAEYFFAAKTTPDLVKAVTTARQIKLPHLVIGQGSNILVSDEGIKGLVIKNSTSQIKLLDNHQVKLDSGVFLPKAIFSLIEQGLVGLEYFVGIPASVGGAVYINLHGQDKFFADYLVSAEILTQSGQIKTVKPDYFKFSYDYSILHQTKDIVLSVVLQLNQGSKTAALKRAQTLLADKTHQPQCSAGCIFQNLTPQQQAKLKLPTPSVGYLIDKQLNLKNKTIGQARISPKHAGFIENLGSAKARDVLQLIELIKTTAKKKLNLELKLEISLLGFNRV